MVSQHLFLHTSINCILLKKTAPERGGVAGFRYGPSYGSAQSRDKWRTSKKTSTKGTNQTATVNNTINIPAIIFFFLSDTKGRTLSRFRPRV